MFTLAGPDISFKDGVASLHHSAEIITMYESARVLSLLPLRLTQMCDRTEGVSISRIYTSQSQWDVKFDIIRYCDGHIPDFAVPVNKRLKGPAAYHSSGYLSDATAT